MRSTSTTLLLGSSLEESTLTSMHMDHFFIHVEEKTLPLHGCCQWSLPTWPLGACTASSPGSTKNWPLPWSVEEDARGQRAGTAPLRHRRNHSVGGGCGQHRGRRTGTWPWGLLLAEPPPRVAGHTWQRRGRQKPEKGIDGGRQGRAFIKKVRMCKSYDD
jgi:hypothetical protein